MLHANFTNNPKINRLFDELYHETEWLRALIRDWRDASGWVMRAYHRDLVRQQIKRIRAINANLKMWGV